MVSPSGTERELARAGAEPEAEQPLLVGRADHRLAVDALDGQPPDAAALHGLDERLHGAGQPLVVLGDEDLQALAAALDVDDRLGAREHDVRPGRAGRRATFDAR